MTHDFDAYADTYGDEVTHSIAFSKQERDYFTRRKADHLLDVSRRLLGNPAQLSAVDVGCGVGSTDGHLEGHFKELHGIDTAGEAIKRAASNNPTVRYQSYDGRTLPFADGELDLAFAINVVHHVPPAERAAFASELRRVLRPGGLAVVFEQNPLNPLTRVRREQMRVRCRCRPPHPTFAHQTPLGVGTRSCRASLHHLLDVRSTARALGRALNRLAPIGCAALRGRAAMIAARACSAYRPIVTTSCRFIHSTKPLSPRTRMGDNARPLMPINVGADDWGRDAGATWRVPTAQLVARPLCTVRGDTRSGSSTR